MTDNEKEKYSRAFIIIGVLAWLPFICGRLFNITLSAIPFLIIHLIGVTGGVLLRRDTDSNIEISPKRKRLKNVSTALLVFGVSVWGVYFGLQWITGVEREITPFLIAHLSGVLSGAGIKLYTFFTKK